MVQLSYPGVYVEEFTPASPIQGVGTSIAALIGTAAQGPALEPVRVESWEAFVRIFGADDRRENRWLPVAARGFFQNGGQYLWAMRVGVGVRASIALPNGGAGANTNAMVARLRREGDIPGVQVTVTLSSDLATEI